MSDPWTDGLVADLVTAARLLRTESAAAAMAVLIPSELPDHQRPRKAALLIAVGAELVRALAPDTADEILATHRHAADATLAALVGALAALAPPDPTAARHPRSPAEPAGRPLWTHLHLLNPTPPPTAALCGRPIDVERVTLSRHTMGPLCPDCVRALTSA